MGPCLGKHLPGILASVKVRALVEVGNREGSGVLFGVGVHLGMGLSGGMEVAVRMGVLGWSPCWVGRPWGPMTHPQ